MRTKINDRCTFQSKPCTVQRNILLSNVCDTHYAVGV